MTTTVLAGAGGAQPGALFPFEQPDAKPASEQPALLQKISHLMNRLQSEILRNKRAITTNTADADSIRADIDRTTNNEWRNHAMCRHADIRMHNRKLEQENSALSRQLNTLFAEWGQITIGVNV